MIPSQTKIAINLFLQKAWNFSYFSLRWIPYKQIDFCNFAILQIWAKWAKIGIRVNFSWSEVTQLASEFLMSTDQKIKNCDLGIYEPLFKKVNKISELLPFFHQGRQRPKTIDNTRLQEGTIPKVRRWLGINANLYFQWSANALENSCKK